LFFSLSVFGQGASNTVLESIKEKGIGNVNKVIHSQVNYTTLPVVIRNDIAKRYGIIEVLYVYRNNHSKVIRSYDIVFRTKEYRQVILTFDRIRYKDRVSYMLIYEKLIK